MKMIGVGKAGHLGGSCSLAEIVAALYFGKMHFDPKALKDPDRDRFLVSKGHSVLDSIRGAGGVGRHSAGRDGEAEDPWRQIAGPSGHDDSREWKR